MDRLHTYEKISMWDDTTLYHGHMSAGKIFKNNGDDTFDYDSYIHSQAGKETLERIMNELVIYGGNQWDHPEMTDWWAKQGVIKTIHEAGDRENAWITYVPDNLEDHKLYPVIFGFHGGGGTLFESENHGFAAICRQEGFIVINPENHNTDTRLCAERVPFYLDKLEKEGLPIDRSRVYLTGMSMGGVAALYGGIKESRLIAGVAAHSSAMELDPKTQRFVPITEEMYAGAVKVPMMLFIGQCDYHQLPLKPEMITGLNLWLQLNGCRPAKETEDNPVGIQGDRIHKEIYYGQKYVSIDFEQPGYGSMVQITGVENQPHWISLAFAKLAWTYLSRFSRENDGNLKIS